MTCDPSRPRDDVGSVGEEAAKLLGALAGWAREHGQDAVAQSAATWSGDHQHPMGEEVAGMTGGSNESRACSWCPVCRSVDWLNRLNPETRDHLKDAGASLIQAAATLLLSPTSGTEGGQVERIVLDDGAWPQA